MKMVMIAPIYPKCGTIVVWKSSFIRWGILKDI